MTAPAELLLRLETSQKDCFDKGLHIAAMDIQAARAEIARLTALPHQTASVERADEDSYERGFKAGYEVCHGDRAEAPRFAAGWRYRHSSWREWKYAEEKPTGDAIHLFEVEPLYASPPRSEG